MKDNNKDEKSIKDIKRKVNEIDNRIDTEKIRIRKIAETQDHITSLRRNINWCIELLSKSMKGPTTQNRFDDMHNSNTLFYIKTASILDEESEKSRKNIVILSSEKDKIIKDSKDQKE